MRLKINIMFNVDGTASEKIKIIFLLMIFIYIFINYFYFIILLFFVKDLFPVLSHENLRFAIFPAFISREIIFL